MLSNCVSDQVEIDVEYQVEHQLSSQSKNLLEYTAYTQVWDRVGHQIWLQVRRDNNVK